MLTEVLAARLSTGRGPAIFPVHSLLWTSHAGRGVRRAVRQLPFCHLILPPPDNARRTQHSGLRVVVNFTWTLGTLYDFLMFPIFDM